MKFSGIVGSLLFILVLARIANAATLYVSPNGKDSSTNPTNIETPFFSLQKAVDWSNPGDIIKLRGGTYKYTSGIWVGKSGTATLPIIIQSYDNEWAVLDGSQMRKTDIQLLGIGGSYIQVKWLEVTNSPSVGINLWNASNVTLFHVNINNSQRSGIYLGADDFEPTSQRNFSNTIDGCTVWNNVKNNRGTTANAGWDSAITLNTHKNIVINCNVWGNWGEGIGAYGQHNYVGYNLVHDNFSVDIYVCQAVGNVIENNAIIGEWLEPYYRNGRASAGIQMANEGPVNVLNGNIIRNNRIKNVWRGLYFWAGGFAPTGLINMKIYGNTVEDCTDAIILIEKDYHAGSSVFNNIFTRNRSLIIDMSNNVENYENILK